MSLELLNHKLDRAFGHMDVNGNGSIERGDLLGLGARILVGFGEADLGRRQQARPGLRVDLADPVHGDRRRR